MEEKGWMSMDGWMDDLPEVFDVAFEVFQLPFEQRHHERGLQLVVLRLEKKKKKKAEGGGRREEGEMKRGEGRGRGKKRG